MPQARTRPRSIAVARNVQRPIALHEKLRSVRAIRDLRAIDPEEYDRLEREFNEALKKPGMDWAKGESQDLYPNTTEEKNDERS